MRGEREPEEIWFWTVGRYTEGIMQVDPYFAFSMPSYIFFVLLS